MDIVDSLKANQCFDYMPGLCDRMELAIEEITRLREQVTALQAECDRAWRERNHAVTKVTAWEKIVYLEPPVMMWQVEVTEWGPGEGDLVTVPELNPQRLTDLLDDYAKLEEQVTAWRAECLHLQNKLAEATEWRDINDAPKDVRLLVWCPKYGTTIADWCDDGWFSGEMAGRFEENLHPAPTHYIPLPAAPSVSPKPESETK